MSVGRLFHGLLDLSYGVKSYRYGKIKWPIVKVTIRPGFSRTVLYFWVLSSISQCPGFVMDLKSSDPSLENVYLSQS